jgi:hypothetical protein
VQGQYHDLVKNTKRLKADSHSFYLDLKSWRKFKTKYKLDWQKVRFEKASQPALPHDRGVYAFVLELQPTKLPVHGYIMYVGITGDDSGGTLYKRYQRYLYEFRTKSGRPAVYYMMENWEGDLHFHYAALPNAAADLAKIEQSFIKAVLPPINKKDIEASLSKAKAAIF